MTNDETKTKGRFLGLERAEWWFWIKWVLATAVGVGVSVALGAAMGVLVGVAGPVVVGVDSATGWGVGVLVASVVTGPMVGPALGTAQWIVLRKRVYRSGWWVLASAVAWCVAGSIVIAWFLVWLIAPVIADVTSAIGGDAGEASAIGGDVGELVSLAVGSVVAGAVVGTALGTAQWLVLRKRVHRSGWWVLVSALVWAVVGPVVLVWLSTWGALTVSAVVGRHVVGPRFLVGAVVAWFLTWPVVGLLVAAITGFVLIMLLRHLRDLPPKEA